MAPPTHTTATPAPDHPRPSPRLFEAPIPQAAAIGACGGVAFALALLVIGVGLTGTDRHLIGIIGLVGPFGGGGFGGMMGAVLGAIAAQNAEADADDGS